MATATAYLTAEQFAEQFEGAAVAELVCGEVVNLSPGGWRHSTVSSNVFELLRVWARRQKAGRVLGNEPGVVTQRHPDTVRGADVAFFSYARVPKGGEPKGFADVAPDLVAEVIGKGQGWDTLVTKAGEYLRMGVQRVWVLDPEGDTLHIFRPDQSPQQLSDADIIRDEMVLPGFSCRVAELFED